MREEIVLIALVLMMLLPYGYILARVISSAYFDAKLKHHVNVINQLSEKGVVDGSSHRK